MYDHKAYKKKRRAHARLSAAALKKNAFLFLRLLLPSSLFFFLGVFTFFSFGAPFTNTYETLLLSFFTAPFEGAVLPAGYIFRILFFSSPYFFVAVVLTLSALTRKKNRVVSLLLCAILFSLGLYYPLLPALCRTPPFSEIPSTSVAVYQASTLLIALLLIIYAYRLSLCFSKGFPSPKASPATVLRFFSFVIRVLLGITLAVAFRTAIATFTASL